MPKSIGEYEEQKLRTRAYGSSKGAALSVILDTLGVTAQIIKVWVKSDGAATFKIYGSQDGGTWTYCNAGEQIVLAGAGEEHKVYFNAYRFIKVATTASNDNEIEIVVSLAESEPIQVLSFDETTNEIIIGLN